ncbi:MAG TPA: prepilin-type N-terminal cleavage/methylation domain-containing protein [Phycisphaerales bacterium]
MSPHRDTRAIAGPRLGCAGFTLVELVISSALLTVLLLAGAATASLVRRAGMSAVGDSSLALSRALTDLRRDIECSTRVNSFARRSISLTVPDRNANGTTESITYSWSGVEGAPLMRSVNGGAAVAIVPSMRSFDLAAETTTVTVLSADQPIAPATQTVATCSTSSGLGTVQVSSSRWVGVTFMPSLPAGTTSWTLSGVRLSLRRHGTADSVVSVQIRSTNGQNPTSTVLASVNINESSLGASYAWVDCPIPALSNLSPASPLAIVIQPVSGTNCAEWQFTGSGGSLNPNHAMWQSTNSGSSWSKLSSQEPLFVITGAPSASAPATEPAAAVRVVRCNAEAIRGVAMAFETEVRTLSASGSIALEAEPLTLGGEEDVSQR